MTREQILADYIEAIERTLSWALPSDAVADARLLIEDSRRAIAGPARCPDPKCRYPAPRMYAGPKMRCLKCNTPLHPPIQPEPPPEPDLFDMQEGEARLSSEHRNE